MEARDVLLLGELERGYLSELIHDDVLQLLGASLLAADTSEQAWRLGRTEMMSVQLEKLRATLGDATDRLRQLMSDLRPYEGDATGLAVAIERIVAAHQRHFAGEVTLDLHLDRPLDVAAAIFAYRSIVDALHCVRELAALSSLQIELHAKRRRLDIEVRFQMIEAGTQAEGVLAPSRVAFVRWRTTSVGGALAEKHPAPGSTMLQFHLPLGA